MTKTIVVASGNAGKIIQIKETLADLNIEVKSMKEFGIDEPIENGKSYSENALIKARNVFRFCNLPTLADDSGFELEEINKFPGLVSGRFADACGGYKNSFEILEKCITENRNAKFCTSMAFVFEKDGRVVEKIFDGKIKGKFIYPPRGTNGFGYCPCFKPDGYDETFAEMDDELRESINHRAVALKEFSEFFKNNF